ncbi:MAG: 3'(2'),5'-bisphosphate nucleotidase [Planctomycetota bacterium]|nr:MAG: 3'(2'),5'-bisphosphate nucleotidase [Planctomycetota bacterium]
MQHVHELSIAVAAVRRAAEVCRNVQRAIPAAMEKQDKSPVTIADFASQAVICRALGEAFPNDPIIGEEDSAELRLPENKPSLDRVQSELSRIGLDASTPDICGWIDCGGATSFGPRFWTLDPIDGTKGFLRGEQYAVSLALIVNGQIEVAILGCPNLPLEPGGVADTGTIFFAVRGQGASVQNCFGDSAAVPVRVTSTSHWADVRLCESVESGHSAHDRSAMIAASLGIVKQPVRLDSQAKYAVVARGEGDVYLRLPTKKDYREKIWDHAGGVLVVEEAGGKVTDIDGKSLEFTHGRELSANRGVVVTNGRLHDDVLRAIREHVG